MSRCPSPLTSYLCMSTATSSSVRWMLRRWHACLKSPAPSLPVPLRSKKRKLSCKARRLPAPRSSSFTAISSSKRSTNASRVGRYSLTLCDRALDAPPAAAAPARRLHASRPTNTNTGRSNAGSEMRANLLRGALGAVCAPNLWEIDRWEMDGQGLDSEEAWVCMCRSARSQRYDTGSCTRSSNAHPSNCASTSGPKTRRSRATAPNETQATDMQTCPNAAL
mmetsp:Transcript_29498/g.56655  ORF Transcript_29498/g.56655 Transcript_29498/m.56655 type:complete len:222 (+) Transcript_29498:397-1062(+)